MEGADTASLRNAAPQWSLAGDKQLLDILQNIHQSLMTRCQEVNRKLDEMVTALDDASVDLQNVNNKFMALSNTQFIESRVYDDDTDVASQEKPKEEPKVPSSLSELELLKRSVRVLESMHEPIQILDSDSDSDTDDEITRTVLKPKDLYSDRPLPHIIGSAAWRNKWHAGLLPEDSDSDSSTSKPERDLEQYSDSEPEQTENVPSELRAPHMQVSSTSSEVTMEQDISSPAPPKPSPADIAAELARRLGQPPAQVVQQTDYSPATPTTRKIYRPEQPPAATIFSDEPPPLNQYQSEGEEYSQDDDDDIFAEFHKNTPQQPYVHSNREQSRLADDLFSGLNKEVYGESDILNDFKDPEPSPPPVAKQKSTLFEDESEPELFATKPTIRQTPQEDKTKSETDGVKKPVGGISLFGSNKGAESIGAAILRRNRRKSSSEEDSTEGVAPKPVKNVEKEVKSTEKDIFDDLFAKSKKEQKVAATDKNKENIKVKEEVKSEKKVDLFSDNIFDDIDDIFTTDIPKVNVKESKKNQKSLFDDDDDDLFSDIAVTKSKKPETKSKNNEKKGLFDSDDDLFSEKPVKNVEHKVSHKNGSDENRSIIKTAEVKQISKSRSIFDDDNSDNDIFSNLAENKVTEYSKTSVISNEIVKSEARVTESQLNKEQNPKTESLANSKVNILNNVKASTSKVVENIKSQAFFDDDEDNDIFNKKSSIDEKPELSSVVLNNEQNKNIESKNKTSIFDDDDIFTRKSLSESKISNKVISVGEKSINDDFKDDELFTQSIENSKVKSEPKDSLFEDIKSDEILNQTNKVVKQDIKENEQKQKAYDQESKEQNDEHFSQVEKKTAGTPIIECTTEIISSISNDVTNQVETIVKSNQPETKTEKSIFDDVLEDELFNQEQTQDKYITKPKLPEADFDQIIDNNKDNNENEALLSSPNESLFNTSSVVSNILDDEPPAFEKPKEPKRSKNVNALFDDDSDDEALFFKKNDALFDEKPEINTDSNNDALFDIFHDEPPAIDIDFTQKPVKNNVIDDFLKTDSDDDLFTALKAVEKDSSKPSITSKPSQTSILGKEPQQYDVLRNINYTSSESSEIPEKTTKVDTTVAKIDKLESPTKETQKSDVLDGSNEPKKIGKLKTMNININVNTLLPGASPKKKQIIEQTDGQVFSAKSQEDLHSKEKVKEKIEPVMTKSVSFEGEPDSKVLDNKISKERAKIQVKRRPSTRRARQEAVRKSAIDFGEDSTDNSSSIDDPPKVETVETLKIDELDTKEIKNEITPKVDELVTNINISVDFESNESNFPTKIHDISPVEVFANNKTESANITNTIVTSNETDNKTKEALNQPLPNEINTKEIEPKIEEIKDVKSKIVYILNDEDIFNTGVEKTIETKKVLSIENDDGLFKNSGNTSKDELPRISTLGNVYKDNNKVEVKGNNSVNKDNNSEINKPKKSLFDDLSDDEELFKNKKSKSKGIIDSDSEEDLFGGKSKKDKKMVSVKETKDVKPKVEVKASLFDDDDDDDLFGVKVKSNTANTSQPSKSTTKEVLPKSTEPVFDDPLSLLGDSDD